MCPAALLLMRWQLAFPGQAIPFFGRLFSPDLAPNGVMSGEISVETAVTVTDNGTFTRASTAMTFDDVPLGTDPIRIKPVATAPSSPNNRA